MHHRSGTRYVRKKNSPWSIMFFRKGTDLKVELKGIDYMSIHLRMSPQGKMRRRYP